MKTIASILIASCLSFAAVVPVKQLPQKTGAPLNHCSGPNVWRLIYEPGRAFAEFQGNGSTLTSKSLYCATTKQEIDAQAASLNLTPAPAAPTVSPKKPAVKPAPPAVCNASNAGQILTSPHVKGKADTSSICVADQTDKYAWRPLRLQ